MNILLCEHDAIQREELSNAIKRILERKRYAVHFFTECNDESAVLAYVHGNSIPTLYLLDIDFCREHGGLDIGREIRERDRDSVIVFIAAFAGQVQLTFRHRLHALDYIVKGACGLDQRMAECLSVSDTILNSDKKKLRLFSRTEHVTIPFEDIYFLESASSAHKINVYHRGGCYQARATLKGLFTRLDDNFMYCHKSFIINRMNVRSIDYKERKVTFEDGLCCWYSKEYAREISHWQ